MNRFFLPMPTRGLSARLGFAAMAIALCTVLMGVSGVVNRADAAVLSPAFVLKPGAATDISEGANGSVWIIGTNPVPGGFGIYHWNGSGWSRMPGGAVTIAVGPDGTPFIVNSAHWTYEWTGSGWVRGPGLLTDLALGADGSAWAIGTNPVPGGFGIYHWNGSGWSRMPGGAVTIAVDPDGTPFVINSVHNTYAWTGSGWALGPGLLTDLASGADGSLWGVGTNPVPGGFGIYTLTDNGWARVRGGAVSITVGPKGTPWIINSLHKIYAS
jgi:hypothetical protein